MKYYKQNNEIFAYELDGSQDDLIGDKTPITLEEVQAINKAKEDTYKATIEYKLAEAKAYLEATDFKVLPDYDEDVVDVKLKRQEARKFIRANEINIGVQA
jgi:hypothetical protein